VKHLVERQGGTIEVRSEGLDRGACFRVRLPCVRNERRETSAEAEDEERLPGVEVIVVDDEEGAAEAIARALRKAGAIAHEAKSVAEALRLFDRTTPQVLVSDIGLPDRDGLDLIRAVRELEEPTRSVLALAVTGFADP
jgi:PleD family two-component response regulator